MAHETGQDTSRAIAKIYERDMDLVLIEEIESSEEFRAWLVARVFGRDCFASHIGARHSVVDATNRESDIVFQFEAAAEGPSAILIENKIDAMAQPNQGSDYRIRGQAGIDQAQWKAFKTCLIAPGLYAQTERDASNYDTVITYEEVLAYFASRKTRDPRYVWKTKLVETAILKKAAGYTPVISREATDFVREYCEHARVYPRLEMTAPKERPAGNTWISLRPSRLPTNSSIEHQVTAGWVKWIFAGAADRRDELRARLAPYLGPGMAVEAAGKSLAVSIRVPAIPAITIPFPEVATQAEEGMRAAEALVAMVEAAQAGGVRF